MVKLSCIFMVSFFTFIFAETEVEQATKAAKEGFIPYLTSCLTPAGRANYQLKDNETVQTATIGEPIEIMDLTPSTIVNYKQGTGVSSLLIKKYSYFFPVLFNGKVKMLLSVHKYTSLGYKHYEIGSLGDVWLAQEFVKLKEQYTYSRNHRMIYAECYEADSYVFTFPDMDDLNLTFINSTADPRSDYTHITTVDEIVKIMDGKIHEDIKKGVRN